MALFNFMLLYKVTLVQLLNPLCCICGSYLSLNLVVVCQDVNSLFDVDTVMNITNHVTRLTGASYGQSNKTDVSLRVITDHIRASSFMIADGKRVSPLSFGNFGVYYNVV